MRAEIQSLIDELHDIHEKQLQVCDYLEDLEEMFTKVLDGVDYATLSRSVQHFEHSRFQAAAALNRVMMLLNPYFDTHDVKTRQERNTELSV